MCKEYPHISEDINKKEIKNPIIKTQTEQTDNIKKPENTNDQLEKELNSLPSKIIHDFNFNFNFTIKFDR